MELIEGTALPGFIKTITQEQINLYAKASGDFNPIHVDEEFARKTQLGGTIAHGMLVLAFISEMMHSAFGDKWLTSGKLGVRFKSPARPGDNIAVSGRVSKIADGLVTCAVFCKNQKDETVIQGDAVVAV